MASEEDTVLELRQYKAWCRLNTEGLPIADSVRSDPALIEGGEAVECRIAVRHRRPARRDDYRWVPVLTPPAEQASDA